MQGFRWLVSCLLVELAVLSLPASVASADEVATNSRVKSGLRVRSTPDAGVGDSNRVGWFYPGETAAVIERDGAWYLVRLESGIVGYAHAEYLRLISERPPEQPEADPPLWQDLRYLIPAVVIFLTFIFGLWPQTKLKRAEAVLSVHSAYSTLLRERDSPVDTAKAANYFLRFWSLQQVEFSLWREGMIPLATFDWWMKSRTRDLA